MSHFYDFGEKLYSNPAAALFTLSWGLVEGRCPSSHPRGWPCRPSEAGPPPTRHEAGIPAQEEVGGWQSVPRDSGGQIAQASGLSSNS